MELAEKSILEDLLGKASFNTKKWPYRPPFGLWPESGPFATRGSEKQPGAARSRGSQGQPGAFTKSLFTNSLNALMNY